MTVQLTYLEQGEGEPLVILHGLFGSARNWGAIQKALADRRRVICVDNRNHGRSPWTDTMTYEDMAEDLLDFFDTQGLERPAVIGHSMGGKVAMAAALMDPDRVDRLLVVDIAPVTYGHSFDDFIDAMMAIDLKAIKRRAEVADILAPVVEDPGVRQFLLQNLIPGDNGFRWQINLRTLKAAMADIMDFPDFDGATFDGQTLFLVGGRSDYVTEDHHDALFAHFPIARIETIHEAGHWAHAEFPDRFIGEARDFLARVR